MFDQKSGNDGKTTDAKGQGESDSNQTAPFAAPSISLPKGGGAIRGMGEKFAANPVTGTGSMTVPIAVTPGRSGFTPQITLSYDSGSGNGPFGLGWSLSMPAITRKTDKGLPKYPPERLDAEESDVFILSGSEDLAPALIEKDGHWEADAFEHPENNPVWSVKRYRPRVEGIFARIERWTKIETGETHWRSISKDNTITLYGKTAESRVADPTDPRRVFSWLICSSYDDKGNAIIYRYAGENSDGVDLSRANERNRSRSANRYLKRVKYGARTPNRDADWNATDPSLLPEKDWMFELVFDYGEHDADDPKRNDAGQWLCRHDPFSSYRSGFEVRAYRLCQRALMFHHFAGEDGVGENCLVRSTDFVYRDTRNNPEDRRKGHPVVSVIASITQNGYKRKTGGGYIKRSLPPLEFEYSEAVVHEDARDLDSGSLENLPIGLDGSSYQWIDLDGDGVSGILTEQAGAWFYKRNLSPISRHGTGSGSDLPGARPLAKFAPVELVAAKPGVEMAGGRAQFMDLAGDGQPDLVMLDGPAPGFYEHDDGEGWNTFRPFTSRLNFDTRDPNLKFVDLDGDGHADVLITESEVFTWHPSLGEDGFGTARRVTQARDEEKGPALVFADGEQSVYLADMSGDGLNDIVRVRNGEVCYWPNLGYGRFGAKVTMDNAPWFDKPDLFDQRRLRLADIDGSGVADIIYLAGDGARLYFNQAGNAWSAPRKLKDFPPIDNIASITTTDLLGNGTACLVWSSPLPGEARRQMRYVDLMGGQKPHLLIGMKNNLGAETRIHYAPSTKFYL
ncbi:MAG: SpvB/TcaC N-terminal domain-containing protein, partial [Blastocatellia bacterium]